MQPIVRARRAAASSAGLAFALVATMSASSAVQQSLGVLGPFLIERFAITRLQLGTLGTVLAVVGSVCSPVVGGLASGHGGRRVLLAPFVLSAAAFLLLAAATGFWWLMAVVVLGGAGMAFANPVTNNLIAAHVRQGTQGLLVGVKQSGVQVAAVCAGVAVPSAILGLGWTRTNVLTAGVWVGLGLIALRLTPLITAPRTPAAWRDRIGLPPAPQEMDIARLAVGALLVGTAISALYTYLPLYAREQVGYSLRAAGLSTASLAAVAIVSRVLWGWRTERLANPRAPLFWLLVAALPGVAALAAARPDSHVLLPVGVVLLGSTAVAWNTVVMLTVVRELPAERTAAASGTVQLGFYVGLAGGPIAFGTLSGATGGYPLGWLGVGAMLAAAAALMWSWTRHPERGTSSSASEGPARHDPDAVRGEPIR